MSRLLYEAAKILVDNEETTELNYGYTMEKTMLMLEDSSSPVVRSYQDKLYESLLSKAHIDFGDIPKSKGNIRDYIGYPSMTETLTSITEIAKSMKATEVLAYVKIVNDAIDNIANLSATYGKGFETKTEYVALEYDVYTYMCVQATSALLYTFVDYIKDPTKDTMTIVIKNNKLRADEFYFEMLSKFNNIQEKQGINYRKMLEEMCNKGRNNFVGSATIVGVATLSAIALSIIPITRACIYQIYKLRSNLSDALELQARYLEMNKSCVENNQTFTDKKRNKVLENQKKLASTLNKLSNTIRVKSAKSIMDSKRELASDNKAFSTEKLREDVNNSSFELL